MRRLRAFYYVGMATLLGYAVYKVIPALEVHHALNELRRFETLMDAGAPNAPQAEPMSPPILIVQHIWKRGPIEAASQRSHAAYARAWGYGYRSDTSDYITDGRHMSLNKIYALLGAMYDELEKKSGDKAEWILYCDADTIISDPAVPVHHLLPPPSLQPQPRILGNEDDTAFNGGVMLFRVDFETYLFVKLIVSDHIRRWSPHLSDEHRIYMLLRSEPSYADYFYRIPKWWLNAYSLEEPSNTPGSWYPRLHVHFVKQLKRKSSFRPVLEQASRIAQRASNLNGTRAAAKHAHPIRGLVESSWTRSQAEGYWAKHAVAGIHGMRFLDEMQSTVVHVP